jgi:hypothetical protein
MTIHWKIWLEIGGAAFFSIVLVDLASVRVIPVAANSRHFARLSGPALLVAAAAQQGACERRSFPESFHIRVIIV